MLSRKYTAKIIQRKQARQYLLINSILGTVLLYGLADFASAAPPQPQISTAPTNEINDNDRVIVNEPIAGGSSELEVSGITSNPSPEFQSFETRQSGIEKQGLGNSSADSLSGEGISGAPLATPKQGSAPPTLEEWKANVPTTAASDLLPPPAFQSEKATTSPEPQNLRAQASSEEPTPQPANPPISPELQRLQQEFLLKEPDTLVAKTTDFVVAPGASITTPIAFGAGFGQVFGGIGFQGRTRYTDSADGALAVGVGVGDAVDIVGLDVTLAIFSLFGDDSFERGGISFKVHRLLPESFAIAVGVENWTTWGGTDAGSSVYGVFSKFFQLKDSTEEPFSQLTVSLGLGGGRFRPEDDIIDGVGSVGIFGSVGLRIVEPMSLVAEWTGQDLNIGASFLPFPKLPLTLTIAGADITNNAGDGARFIMSIGYNYLFPR